MRYSKSYLYLLALNQRNRYLYTIGLSTLILFSWLFLWYLPFEKKLTQLDREMTQQKKDAQSDSEQQASCKNLTDRFMQLQHDLKLLCTNTVSDAHYITQLTAYVENAHMRLVSLRIAEQADHGWYTSTKINFEALGTFPAITQFFARLAEDQMLIQCDDLSLQRQADDTFLLHCMLRRIVPDTAHIVEVKSPSTLKKAEGLGG